MTGLRGALLVIVQLFHLHSTTRVPSLHALLFSLIPGNCGVGSYLQGVGAAKVLLNAKVTGVLPGVVLVGEDAGLAADLLEDLLHGDLLVLRAGNSVAVGVTTLGPADLSDVLALGGSAGADLSSLSELLSSEVTGLVGRDGGGEVRVDLDGENVNVVAESSALLLPGAYGLSGGDSNVRGETAAAELVTDVVDVAGELFSLAVAVEHALVSNDDHGNAVLGGLVGDLGELVVGVLGERTLASTLKEDAVDDLETILLAGGYNELEDAAVGAVGTDGGEAHIGNLLDITLDLITALALAVLGIGGVGHGPLVTLGDDAATRAVATGWLGLLDSLGAGLSWWSWLRRLRGLGGGRRREVDWRSIGVDGGSRL